MLYRICCIISISLPLSLYCSEYKDIISTHTSVPAKRLQPSLKSTACIHCLKLCSTNAGLANHIRKIHPEYYHPTKKVRKTSQQEQTDTVESKKADLGRLITLYKKIFLLEVGIDKEAQAAALSYFDILLNALRKNHVPLSEQQHLKILIEQKVQEYEGTFFGEFNTFLLQALFHRSL